jgi:hypothetical protein
LRYIIHYYVYPATSKQYNQGSIQLEEVASMPEKRPINLKIYTRAITAIALIVVWVMSAFSGLILWLAPEGRQAGKQSLLFGITKQEWGDVHFWVCVAVVVVTIIHMIIDWKALRGIIRYLTAVHRDRIGG